MLEDICFNDIEQEILKEILALQIKVSWKDGMILNFIQIKGCFRSVQQGNSGI